MAVDEIPEEHDLLVIGGGPGGYVAALHAARLGREVTLVDALGPSGMGGTCLRVGCIPSKALIDFADRVLSARELATSGALSVSGGVDLGVFQGRRKQVVDQLTSGVRGLLDQAGVNVVPGRVRFQREGQVIVTHEDGSAHFFAYEAAVAATGSRPVMLPQLPHDGTVVLDSTDVLELDTVPDDLVVVGGGYIGVEIGTALAKLGTRVTMVEALDRLLPTMAPVIGREVAARLEELGATVCTGTRTEGMVDGELVLVDEDGESRLPASHVLVAVGRRPNTDELGLESLGVELGADGLAPVGSDRLLTPTVAAIGDIAPGPALAHKAMAEAVVAVDALCGRPAAFEPAAIPAVVFSDPEVAVAGMTAAEAAEAGIEVEVSTFPVAASGRALSMGASRGQGALVVDVETQAVLGVELVGPHASELVAEGVLAIEMTASVEDLGETIHAHPTMSELYAETAHIALGRPVHSRRSPKRVRAGAGREA